MGVGRGGRSRDEKKVEEGGLGKRRLGGWSGEESRLGGRSGDKSR